MKLILNFLKKHWGIIVILLLSLISLNWFQGKELLFGDDTSLPLNLGPGSFLDNYFYLLQFKIGYYGISSLHLPYIMPIGLILKFIEILGLPFSGPVYQRILIYYLLAASGISFYFFLSLLFNKLSIFTKTVCALIYSFNIYTLQMWNPLPHNIFIYSFFPLISAVFIKWIDEEKPLKYAFTLAIIFSLTITPGFMHLPSIPICFFILFIYFIIKLWQLPPKGKIKIIQFSFVFFVSWILLNAFWLIPPIYFFSDEFFLRTQGHNFFALMQSLYKSQLVQLKDAIVFQGNPVFTASINNNQVYPWVSLYSQPIFKFISLFIPFFTLLGFFIKNNTRILFIKLLLVISLILVSSDAYPFSNIILFIFTQTNLSSIYRSSYQRFMPIFVYASLIIFALGFDAVWQKSARFVFHKIKRLLLIIVAFVLIFVYVFPFWTGRLFESGGNFPSRNVIYPSYVKQTADWIDRHKENFSVLPLPLINSGHTINVWNKGKDGYYGLYPLVFLSTKKYLIDDIYSNRILTLIEKQILSDNLHDARLLNYFNIKYLLIHHDYDWRYTDSIIANKYKKNNIENRLKLINGLTLVKTFGSIDIYENTQWQPTLFFCTINQSTTINNLITDYQFINYCPNIIKKVTMINPTSYKVEIDNKQHGPFVLVFNELFERGWYLENNNKQYQNQQSNLVFNSFYIDEVKKQNLQVEYFPQKVFYVSSIISILTFLIVIIMLTLCYLRKKYDNKNH